MKSLSRFISFAPLAAVCLSSADAAILLTDNFTDGNLTGGTDNSGIAWYARSGNATLGIANDPSPGFGTGNALVMERAGAGTIVNRGIIGVLTNGITLSNPGDTVTLSFSFRFTTTASSTSPFSDTEGFTFGFYNSNGTPVSANGSSASDNDLGYRAEFGSGTDSWVGIAREANFTTAAGGVGTGTDGVQMTVVDPVAVSIGDFLPRTGSITLTYNSPTDMGISVSYNGNVVGTATNNAPITTFDEVVFSQGGGNGFLLDNVVVTSNVPEPGSVALMALGGVLCAAGYRRRK
ncbi:PEP-CTERM sorting domain-containing protein [Luteolibacter sp. SL250]|uniref:PEP-CTERM sorting domain-containing protein n=1 Tax=Luteolibacter sp. SL250 TaxID=2995170 RepID=UPI002271E5A4|nr:PEP-CTERM sorting domain-containing protein [Luteolibacter sp. SL250]WAC18811.1 PEP-CTERM sorting domain-containing protein [Luteolibacter sp. SL250]